MSAAPARFTLDGSELLERRLEDLCDQIAEAVRASIPPTRLEGVALGGGYGRGEGGVLQTAEGEAPYNDLEFYVFLRGSTLVNERRYYPALHKASADWSSRSGVDVEFKIASLATLRSAPATMFYYDLVSAHRWLIGNDQLLAGCEHHSNSSLIPLSEATRLLLNRCSGLLFSADLLGREQFGAEAADFTGRNLAKAQLALGDVVLAVHRQYHWSSLERHGRLQRFPTSEGLPWLDAVRTHHAAGVAFKLHPTRSAETRERLSERHRELVKLAAEIWLWLEAKRLGRRFRSMEDYALSSVNKCPETHPLKNSLIQLRTFRAPEWFRSKPWRYPRERLLESLALLLFDADALSAEQRLQAVSLRLGVSLATLPAAVASYRQLWNRFN
jgi:hypothetical protein